MEKVTTQEALRQDEKELFDSLAAITLLVEARRDGNKQAEVRAFERLRTEELTQIAEGLETYLKTEFVYEFDPESNCVVGFNGEPIAAMTNSAVKRAERLLEKPGFDYIKPQLDRYRAEEKEQQLVDALMRGEVNGNTIITFSPYPFNIQQEYGEDVTRDLGYEPKTKRSMVRVFQRELSEDGELQLRAVTISLERSNLDLMRQLAVEFGLGESELKSEVDFLEQPLVFDSTGPPAEISSQLAARYDEMRHKLTGEYTFHGLEAREGKDNSWDAVQRFGDVIEWHLSNLRLLSDSMQKGRINHQLSFMLKNWSNAKDEDERFHLLKTSQRAKLRGAVYDGTFDEETAKLVKELMTYSAWATIKNRLDKGDTAWHSQKDTTGVLREMMNAGLQQAKLAEAMVGCGGAIRFGENGKDDYSLLNALFGSLNRLEAAYSFNRYMHCVSCQRPPKKNKFGAVVEKKKWCGPCGLCRNCDKRLSKT